MNLSCLQKETELLAIKVSFGSLFKEINGLIDSVKLTVDGQDLIIKIMNFI